ncbi:MAG TPA: DUF1552 domain-containing protein [Polyangiaceae bacterium]|nr:DUF1552 domain-containing protein [Polyangiaceae bacterium]
MTSFRLSRRAALRGAGTIAIALPWLEIMREERAAHAAGAPAKRFIAVYTPGGTVHAESGNPSVAEQWSPTGTETNFELSPILTPYEPVKSQLLVLDGIDMKSAVGEQLQSGMIAWLTGTGQARSDTGEMGYASGPSIDQVLSGRLTAGDASSSLELAVRWGTGKTHGRVTPMGVVSFANDEKFTPRPPQLDPIAIWKTLFGSLDPNLGKTSNWDKSILDYVDKRYVGLSAKLGTADKQRIDQHLNSIRELERGVAQTVAARCIPLTLIDTSDYDPFTGLKSSDDGSVKDSVTDAAIPKVGKLMVDMLVMALACDRTSVATFMWSDAEAKHTYPWLQLPETFSFYQNGGGYRPQECAQIGTWYASQNSYLLQQMAKVDMGGHSLLDESVVFFGSEVSNPATHKKNGMPFLLAGGGGGLRGGRWLKYDSVSHNDLLAAILNLFDYRVAMFGDARYCSGAALPNLI